MPFDANTGATVNYPRLASKHDATVRALQEQRRLKAAADAASRAAESEISRLQGDLFSLMGGAPVAFCGPFVLTREPGKVLPATVKTVGGRTIPLADIVSLKLADKSSVNGSDIASAFGGRSGSDKLNVTAG